jgi:VanZ family protein
MSKKSVIFLILTIAMMVVIFIFSNQEGSVSYGESYKFEDLVQSIIDTLHLNFLLMNHSVAYATRKYAHVFLYFVLGFFSSLVSQTTLSFKAKDLKGRHFLGLLISCAICFVYACTDEFHQTFIDGRTGKFSDVMVDAIGFVSSGVLVMLGQIIKDKISKMLANR